MIIDYYIQMQFISGVCNFYLLKYLHMLITSTKLKTNATFCKDYWKRQTFSLEMHDPDKNVL